jgi:hypothetical protein
MPAVDKLFANNAGLTGSLLLEGITYLCQMGINILALKRAVFMNWPP